MLEEILRKRIIFLVFILIVFLFINSSYAKINKSKFLDEKNRREVEIVADEILVKFKESFPTDKIEKFNKAQGVKFIKKINKIHFHRLKTPKGKNIEQILETYKENSNVVFVEPNFIAKESASVSDPDFIKNNGD